MTENIPIEELRQHIKQFKRLAKARWDKNCATGLYLQKSGLLIHVVDGLEQFTWLEVLNASQFEMSSMQIRERIRPHLNDKARELWKQLLLWSPEGKRV